MKVVALVALTILFWPPLTEAKDRKCTLRIHAEANANDTSVFSLPVQLIFSGKHIFVEKTPVVFEGDVSSFYPFHAKDGSYGALIQLNDHGKLALDTVSIERRGTFLVVFLDGRQLTELQIDRRVSDGKIYLPSGLTEEDMRLMSKAWHMTGTKKT